MGEQGFGQTLRSDPSWLRSRLVVASALVMACLVLGGCSHRGVIAVDEVRPDASGRVLLLLVPTCKGRPVATATESPEKVVIRTVSTSGGSHELCRDNARVTLSTPLNGRSVIDAATGKAAKVVLPADLVQ